MTRATRRNAGRSWWATLALALVVMLPLHGADAPTAETESNADHFFRLGVQQFFAAKPVESVAAFDQVITRAPTSEPHLWQRGLSLYYAGRFADGRVQFEHHQTVNSNDVENAAWHFLCVAKAENVAAARAALIPISGDGRVPMREIHALFAGTGDEAAVLRAADADGKPDDSERDQLCYAHLYLGLWHEANNRADLARTHLRLAAIDFRMDHYMGKVAQVHVKLRGWQDAPPSDKP
jgi:lipoprotein NlpI